MNISNQVSLATYSLKQAIGTTVISKAVNQDAQSIQTIMEMASDVAKSNGVGNSLDIEV